MLELGIQCIESRLGETQFAQTLAKPPDRGVIGHGLVEREAAETPERQAVVDRSLDPFIRQAVPLL